jgi:hypothetical protein
MFQKNESPVVKFILLTHTARMHQLYSLKISLQWLQHAAIRYSANGMVIE